MVNSLILATLVPTAFSQCQWQLKKDKKERNEQCKAEQERTEHDSMERNRKTPDLSALKNGGGEEGKSFHRYAVCCHFMTNAKGLHWKRRIISVHNLLSLSLPRRSTKLYGPLRLEGERANGSLRVRGGRWERGGERCKRCAGRGGGIYDLWKALGG